MAEIVGGVGVPHTPHFPGIVDRDEPLAPELRRLYGAAARHLRELAPDFLVFFTCDHYNIFFVESVPIFSIGVAPSARGPSDYRELKAYTVPIASDLARHIQAEAVRSGFDVGMSQEFEFDHPVTVPLHFLTPQMDVPIVPVFVNGLIPPLPPAARCYALGARIRETLTGMPGSARVATVASGSFSLEIGGPRLSATSHTGIPDPGWADRVVELMRAGDVGTLVAEASEERLTHAGNAAGELLTWIAMLGLVGCGPAAFLEAQPEFGHAFGCWRAGGPGRPM
jgi:aromatic ring-opening dioxygenase catalytic subunit (LigB family)